MKWRFSGLIAIVAVGALCAAAGAQETGRGQPGLGAGVSGLASARAEEERAIRAILDGLASSFEKGDAGAIAGSFTEDGEAVDAAGGTIQGRKALAEHYASRIAASPGDRMTIEAESIAMIAPGVARVLGRTRLAPSDGSAAVVGRYAGILVKRDGRWLLASVREIPEADLTPHERLKELEWLVGDWVEESDEAVVTTSVAWADGGNFLLRSFDVRVKGKPALSGTQRIGWDPLTKQFKSWVFDTQGGYGEGLWMRQGNQWVIKATGVRPDGRVATATQVLTYVTRDSLRWKSIDRTLGSEISGDIDEVLMVRKPPQPR